MTRKPGRHVNILNVGYLSDLLRTRAHFPALGAGCTCFDLIDALNGGLCCDWPQ